MTERGPSVTDKVSAQLVDCVPEEPTVTTVPQPCPDDATPTEQSADATVEHTGADPPPE